ncbi:PDZ domain-containing protein [Myxococcota bacterium]|nr:PDZ domain-containing protein [Myxococcota bacterium]
MGRIILWPARRCGARKGGPSVRASPSSRVLTLSGLVFVLTGAAASAQPPAPCAEGGAVGEPCRSTGGIGVRLEKVASGIAVLAVFEGQSAHAAGLQAGDVIVRVAGVDVASQSLGEAVSRITGPAGTSVRIEVVRGGGRLVFDVTRRAVDLGTAGIVCVEGECVHGEGVQRDAQGVVRRGTFSGGFLNGSGRMEWPDGRVIEGTFKAGVLSGQGRLAQPDGTVFTGSFVGGMRHGTVRTTHPDGAWTEDRWAEDRLAEALRYGGPGFTCERGDCFDGQGSVLWANGDSWEGAFRNGAMAGVGVHRTKEGRRCELTFTSDVDQRGRCTWPDGGRYEGTLRGVVLHGSGTYTAPDGRVYRGEFRDGARHGRGTFRWPEGIVRDALWDDGQTTGAFTQTWPDGRRYAGTLDWGVTTWPDGRRYEGKHSEGVAPEEASTGGRSPQDRAPTGTQAPAASSGPVVAPALPPRGGLPRGREVAGELPPPSPGRAPDKKNWAYFAALMRGTGLKVDFPQTDIQRASRGKAATVYTLATGSYDQCATRGMWILAVFVAEGPVPRAQSVAVICEGGLTAEVRYDGASGSLRMYRGEPLVAEFPWRPGPEFDRAVAAWWGWFSP